MAKKRFALIGAGLFGEVHAKAYSTHPEAELAVVCDLDQGRAREIGAKYGAERYCADWREVVPDAGIDAVSVATPDFAHTDIAVAAARNKKHIPNPTSSNCLKKNHTPPRTDSSNEMSD